MTTDFSPQYMLAQKEIKQQGAKSKQIDFAWGMYTNDKGLYDQEQKTAALHFLKKTYKTDSVTEISDKLNIKHQFIKANAYEVLAAFKRLNTQAINYLPEEGPLPKSNATYLYEDLVRQLMRGAKFTSELGSDGQMIHIEGGESYNITQIMTHADLSHLNFTKADLIEYETYCHKTSEVKPEVTDEHDQPIYPSNEFFQHADKTALFSQMSYAEKLAINIYTTNYYNQLNPFMRGAFTFNDKTIGNQRDVIIHAAILGKALGNKNNSALDSSFRYEGVYDEALLSKRISISQNGGAEIIKGFISTAKRPAATFKNIVAITYTQLKGIYVAPLSRFPHEREFLIPPTQITYSGYIKDGDTHYFCARPIIDLALIQEEAKTLANINQVINSKMKEVFANLQTMRGLVQESCTPEEYLLYKEQITLIDNWQNQQFGQLIQDMDKISKKNIATKLNTLSDKLSDLSQELCLNVLKRFDNYKLGYNDEHLESIIAQHKTNIEQKTDWTDLKQVKTQLDADLALIKEKIIDDEREQNMQLWVDDIKEYLTQIQGYQFGDNDEQMTLYITQQKTLLDSAKENPEKLSALRNELKSTLRSLKADSESEFIRQTIKTYKEGYGVRMQSKANRLEQAMTKVPVMERAQIHKGENQAKEVLCAMASHRLSFNDGKVYLKNGVIDENKAANTYKEFKNKFNDLKNNEPDKPTYSPQTYK
ncbi:MAG: hypothetical protein PSV35_05225 [bacterium]|nr:hypothetical protein [bacterium]